MRDALSGLIETPGLQANAQQDISENNLFDERELIKDHDELPAAEQRD